MGFDSIFTVVTLWGETMMLDSEQQSWNKSLPHTVDTSWADCDQLLEDGDKYQAALCKTECVFCLGD